MKAERKPTPIDGAIPECKDVADVPKFILDWIDQATEAALDYGTADWFLVFHRPQTTNDYVMMPKEYFGKLMKHLHAYEEEGRQKEEQR
jgi:hypothetical protein